MEKKGGLTRREQIERDKAEIERLQNRVKQNEAKEREKERKERTKRLIELGAIVESRFSENAVSVLRVMPKSRLAKIDEWLAAHVDRVEHLAKELEAETAAAKKAKENPPTGGAVVNVNSVPHGEPAEVRQAVPSSVGSVPCTSERPNGQ